MSDQPKPTTGECTCDESASDVIIDQYCPQHGSLKPTPSEWIGGNCKFCNEPDGKHKADCRRDAINAALAADREKVKMLSDALHFYRNHDDNGQTATDALRKAGIEK